jgi:isopentenyl-diphosphate Delta-isomerase
VRNQVILVDESDTEIGVEDKARAHFSGSLHRAFSVWLLNTKGEVLLQRRALSKYHAPGKWSNSCCSHPQPGECTKASAESRLSEELGITCSLVFAFKLRYHVPVESLIENELDYVYVGHFEGRIDPNPSEVDDWRWLKVEDLLAETAADRGSFTPWMLKTLGPFFSYLTQQHASQVAASHAS